MITVPVRVGAHGYDVLVGARAREALPSVIPPRAKRVAVVTQATVPLEVEPGRDHRVFVIDEGETAKSLTTVEGLCREFARFGLTRGDVVVSVGGGLVTDVAGFAAAVYHRGVAVVHVATTLLAMVDAAIGGKTGVNLPEGKNLVGAFWQPVAVLCDTDALATLPPREYRSGLGEMAKYHFLTGEDLMAMPLDERIARCVAIKAAFVADDEREEIGASDGAGRAALNYGHTLAHALEVGGRFDLRHGEAVAIGLVFAAELAWVLGRIDSDRVRAHRVVLEAYDLPQSLPSGVDLDELIVLMGRDKKAIDGLTFVLDGPHGASLVGAVDRSNLLAAFARMEP